MKYSKDEVALLDEFAKVAMQSILRDEDTYKRNTSEAVAHWAYLYAEAMMNARQGFIK